MRLIVTGGCSFIGSHLVAALLDRGDEVLDIDRLTYAADPERHRREGYTRLELDVSGLHPDRLRKYGAYEALIHLAAESHVDASLADAGRAVRTNVMGTCRMLDVARALAIPRVVVVSTDEVTGPLSLGVAPTTAASQIRPTSPYAASKAGAELLALAYQKSYGQHVVAVRPTNCYGPGQHPEKFIPRCATYALTGKPLPLFPSSARASRDWLHVGDCATGLLAALERGRAGGVYCLGARNEQPNLDVARLIAKRLGGTLGETTDRPGHDLRYATDPSEAERALGWKATAPWPEALEATLDWYAANEPWWQRMIARGGKW